ncbi:MAG: hypothetical protein PHW76_04220 [Alphaproteobacteria bacterium]|nr:hypothetical protein [Alphaproteobacteria bacterium]
MAEAPKIYRDKNFGPYGASYTTEADIEEVIKLIDSKGTLDPSKRDAVYRRKDDILEWTIRHGLFVKIYRKATNEEEKALLGGKSERIVSIAGGYLLNFDQRILTEASPRDKTFPGLIAEMGTGLAVHSNDLPNADGECPSRCFCTFIAAAVALRMFQVAGEQLDGRDCVIDKLITNVQDRPEMRPILDWLLKLGWRVISLPSEHLKSASAATTTDVKDYGNRKKFFLELPTNRLPDIAEYLLTCQENRMLEGDQYPGPQHIAHVDIDFNPEMVAFLEAVRDSEVLKRIPNCGYTEMRRHVTSGPPKIPEMPSQCVFSPIPSCG